MNRCDVGPGIKLRSDSDNIPECADNCFEAPNPNQFDSNAVFDRRTGEFTGNLTVKNNSTQDYSGPITVVFKSITPSSVYAVNPEIQWVDPNNPATTYPAFVWNETLAPGATSTIKKVRFYNPQRARMSYTSQAWAMVEAN